jgi:hypothetical protein
MNIGPHQIGLSTGQRRETAEPERTVVASIDTTHLG